MRAACAAFSVCLLLVPLAARGQGFGVYEQGTCMMARGGTGVAEPCEDGSAVYINPAGLPGRRGLVISGGGTLLVGSSTFRSDAGRLTELKTRPHLAPHTYLAWGLTDRLSIAGGLYAPYGLGVEWPIDFEGRFVSYESELQNFHLQPTMGYAINKFVSIGAGVTIARGRSIKLYRREDLADVPLPGLPGLTFESLVDRQTDLADTRLTGSAGARVGANLGAIVTVKDGFRVGARYLTGTTLNFDGMATFRPVSGTYVVTKPNPLGLPVGTPLDPFVSQVLSALQDQPVETEIEMPAQFVAGVSVRPKQALTILADYHWVGWSAFDSVTLDFSGPIPPDEVFVQNYRNTSAARLGVEIEATPAVRLRAGYAYNQAAAPDETVTPLLPEAQRNHLTGGVGWTVHPNFTIDVAYQFIGHADRRGRVVNPPAGQLPTTALNSGVYQSRGDLLGITMTFRP